MIHKHSLNFMSLSVVVEYSYTPAERATLEYPGCPEEFEVISVFHAGEAIDDFLESAGLDSELKNSLIQDLRGE